MFGRVTGGGICSSFDQLFETLFRSISSLLKDISIYL